MEEELEIEYSNNEEDDKKKPSRGMKWFKFLIYFALWAGAILNIIYALQAINGTMYKAQGIDPAKVYRKFPGLRDADNFYGIACLIFAVWQIITRYALAKYRKCGPIFLYIAYVLGILISVIYMVSITTIVSNIDTSTCIAQIFINSIMLLINWIYFHRRKHLFNK